VTRLLAAVGVLAAVLAGCRDDGSSGVPTIATTAPVSTSLPTVAIDGEWTCGPTDGSAVSVAVDGAAASTLRAELVIDGEAVAISDPVNTSRDSLLVEVPVDPAASARNDVITMFDTTGASVRVRPSAGGPVVAVDRSISPYVGGGCG
jgi:hypothetical protein